MNFGNWNVTDNSITWNGGGPNRFEIPKGGLNATRQSKANGELYDWILKATAEDWITQNDLFDLNFAFVYAAATLGKDFNYETFDATLAEQYEQFDAEELEEEG